MCYFVDTRVQYTPKVPFVEVIVEEMMRRFPALQTLQIYASKDAAYARSHPAIPITSSWALPERKSKLMSSKRALFIS